MHWTICYGIYTLVGFIGTVFGPVLPFLIEKFSLSLAKAGSLFFLLSLGQVCASGTAHGLMSRFGPKRVILVGLLCMGLGLVAVPLAPKWFIVLVSVSIMGAGWGTLEVGLNAFVSHWSSSNPGPALNRLHLFFALGAWLGPSAISIMLLSGVGWQSFFVLLALCYVVFILIWAAMPSQLFELAYISSTNQHPDEGHSEDKKASLKDLLMAPGILTLGLIMLIYVGVEVSITGWITTFFIRSFNSTAAFGASVVSLFWAGLTLGRLVCSVISQRIEYLHLMLLLCGGMAVTIALGAVAPTPMLATLLFSLAGFFCSGIFPTIVACGARVYPKWVSPLAGYFSTVAGIGAMSMPWLLGMVADSVGLGIGMLILSVLMAVASALAYALRRDRNFSVATESGSFG